MLAELDLAFGERLGGVDFGACRQRLEDALRFGKQVFVFSAGAAVVILVPALARQRRRLMRLAERELARPVCLGRLSKPKEKPVRGC